jgi:hypothetical protein
MIVSASRRTDIPAFYGRWFVNRLKAGYALVRNPVAQRLVYRVPLSPDRVRCIVFWTKDPRPLLELLDEIDARRIPYYFLFTVNPYGPDIERNLPDKDTRVRTFVRLAERLGADRVVWRYDPIFFTPEIGVDEHIRSFRSFAEAFTGLTRRCIISYLSMYNKTRRNMRDIDLLEISSESKNRLLEEIKRCASDCGIELRSCASQELAAAGIEAGKCIDDALIAKITQTDFVGRKDRSQRKLCGCVESVDIGSYDTCRNQCLYCYANSNFEAARRNWDRHDPDSELLLGELKEDDTLVPRS